MQFVLVLYVGLVVCLCPVAVYLVWLSKLARRGRPTVVVGAWDFVALLAALSGFTLYGGGLLLSLFRSNARYGLRGNFAAFKESFEQEAVTWGLVVLAYLTVVLGTALFALLSRRRTLVVYNVEPASFEHALVEVFGQIGQSVERRGNTWSAGVPLFEIDAFEAGRTVTLRWKAADGALFQEVERYVRLVAPGLTGGHNPAGRWFMSVAIGLFATAATSFAMLLYFFAIVR